MSLKEIAIEKILASPKEFTLEDFKTLVNLTGDEEVTFFDIRLMLERIYSLNDSLMLENSSQAYKGTLGWLNLKSNSKRLCKFNQTIKKIPANERVNILAEGDSWFQFPILVKDIIDWLGIFSPANAIYSIAYGGNWITNIIYDGKYVAELPIIDPAFFLISGGGNDLVENNHLAVMVKNPNILSAPPQASDYVTKDFYAFVIAIKLQYYMMFRSIRKKYKDVTIITQGYDYAIPSYAWRWCWRYPYQYFVNWFSDSGGWLKRPLDIKGIPGNMHQPIIKLLIDEINEMYIELAQCGQFGPIFHIDCRKITNSHDDWFDELHLKPHVFKKVAEAYQQIITNKITYKPSAEPKSNVIRVVDLILNK